MIALYTQKSPRVVPARAARVTCCSGVVWVMCEGDLHDFILAPGEFIEIARGLSVVIALEPAVVSVMQHASRSWLRGMLETLRARISGRSDATAASAG